jgi:hypothetical protein
MGKRGVSREGYRTKETMHTAHRGDPGRERKGTTVPKLYPSSLIPQLARAVASLGLDFGNRYAVYPLTHPFSFTPS